MGKKATSGISLNPVACERLVTMQQLRHDNEICERRTSSMQKGTAAKVAANASVEAEGGSESEVSAKDVSAKDPVKPVDLPAPSPSKSPSPKSPAKLTKGGSRFSTTGKLVAKAKASKSTGDAAVLQAQGMLGNAQCIDDETVLPMRILIYRLVSLDPTTPWGDGLLLELARTTEDDEELKKQLMHFLSLKWRDDPVRTQMLKGGPLTHAGRRDGIASAIKGKGVLPALNAARKFAKLRRASASTPEPVEEDETSTWSHVLVHGRGTVGETALHLLCLLATAQHLRVIRALVPWLAKQSTKDVDDEIVNSLDATYIGQPYNGEVALHFAVIAQNFDLVKLLVEHGASINAHASGDFLYSDPKLYFGGTILGFAACLGNIPIVEYLIENGADVDAQDQGNASGRRLHHIAMAKGNSVLHCCVLHQQAKMYWYLATKHNATPWVTNVNGDSPLLLAAKMRSTKMAREAMECMKQTLWVFGPVMCVRYPLLEIEAGQNWGKSRRQTVLQVMDTYLIHELLFDDVLWKLTNDKWHSFARRTFLWNSLLNLISVFSLAFSLLAAYKDKEDGLPGNVGDGSFCVTLMITFWLLLLNLVVLYRLNKSLLGRSVIIMSCMLPWISLPLRFLDNLAPYRVVTAFASALGWLRFMLDTSSLSAKIGPTVMMVMQIVKSDVLPFLVIYACFFCMMMTLLFGIYRAMGADATMWDVAKTLFSFTINPGIDFFNELEVEKGELLTGGLPILTNVLQVVWVVLGNVVLLNVIIAMMNSTYGQVFDQQEARWRLQFLQQVLFQEATPQFFIPPFLGVQVTARPGHHIKSQLQMTSADGKKRTSECYFLQMVKENKNQDPYAEPVDQAADQSNANASALAVLQETLERVEAQLAVLTRSNAESSVSLNSLSNGSADSKAAAFGNNKPPTARKRNSVDLKPPSVDRRPSMSRMEDMGEGLNLSA
ncbi:hypothetical protein AB1Y20_012090 [Prymnesium parvum]|uniref:Ion transport domain-containing protein n=1 Tax=Prymnesium parvum TaxID=97485 RepID=A0AB34IPY2_PRYPA